MFKRICEKCKREISYKSKSSKNSADRKRTICHQCSTTKPAIERFWKYVEKTPTCWNWIGAISKYGYGHLINRIEGKNIWPHAHRFSWEIHNGQIPEGMCVCHKCDNKRCVNPDHLFLGTQQDNMTDKCKKGRQNRGETHGNSKFTEEQVREIKYINPPKNKREMLVYAGKFGVTYRCIWCIVHNKRWSHI